MADFKREGENLADGATDDLGTEQVTVSEPTPKKRGRKPGSTNKKASSASSKMTGKQIAGVHHMMAIATGIPELQITEDEGNTLVEAMDAVSREYGVTITGKTAATLQLMAAAGMIYGPRVLIVAKRVKEEKKQMQTAHSDNELTPSGEVAGADFSVPPVKPF